MNKLGSEYLYTLLTKHNYVLQDGNRLNHESEEKKYHIIKSNLYIWDQSFAIQSPYKYTELCLLNNC